MPDNSIEVDAETLEGKLAIVGSLCRHVDLTVDVGTNMANAYVMRKLCEIEHWLVRIAKEHPEWREPQ